MTDATTIKDKIKAEIAALDAQAVQMLANANFANGAKRAFEHVLEQIEATEKEIVAKVEAVLTPAEAGVKEAASDLETGAKQAASAAKE